MHVTADVIGQVSPVTAEVWLETLLGLVVHITQKVPPLLQRWNPGLDLLVEVEGAGTWALTRKSLRFFNLEKTPLEAVGRDV